MPPSPSLVTPEVARRVAELARLRLPDAEISRWAGQLSRIVAYIDQLTAIPEEAFGELSPEPPTPVRADESRPGGGAQALEANAPRMVHGYGVVPRVVGSGG